MLQTLTGPGNNENSAQQAWEIYESSFPPDERLDYESFVRQLQNPDERYDMLAIKDEKNSLKGVLGYWVVKKAGEEALASNADSMAAPPIIFLEHLAVAANARNEGLGKKAMEEWLDKLKQSHDGSSVVVLEVDPPSTDEFAERRIGFYERLGFSVISIDYEQPAYSDDKDPVPLWLMGRRLSGEANSDLSSEQSAAIKQRLLSDIYGKD